MLNKPLDVQALWVTYLESSSIHKAVKGFGVTYETGRRRLIEAGYQLRDDTWDARELEALVKFYRAGNQEGFNLSDLALLISRSHAAIACKAHELGLTYVRGKFPRSYAARSAMAASKQALHPKSRFTNTKRGFREDIGVYVRSSWEANYARLLNRWITENKITKWEYEPVTFWFEKIKRGTRSYKPDFRVILPDGSVEYHEVKGWMYPKAITSLRRMKLYHPNVKLILVDQKAYRLLEAEYKTVVPNWELKDAKKPVCPTTTTST